MADVDEVTVADETVEVAQEPAAPLLGALHTRALGTKFTTEIEAEIAELAAGWPELISLGSGDPDLDTPAHIRAAATAAIENGATHYTPHNGLPELRAAISNYLSSSLGLTYAPDEICTTSGVQEALMVAMLALVGPGDEILCPVPTYSVYLQQAALLGAKIVEVPCEPEDDFIMMPDNVEKLITPRTKVLIHMSPNNPTGAVTPPGTVKALADLAIKYNLVVMSDEIYADQMYDGHKHVSIGTMPGMRDRTIILHGTSKAYAMTGWRVGYLAAPREFISKAGSIAGQLSLSVSAPSQHAALAAYTGPQEVIQEMVDIYAERRTYMFDRLNRLGFKIYGGNGGYMCWVDITAGSGQTALEFQRGLLKVAGVQLGGSGWNDKTGRFMRLSFLTPMDKIVEAFDAIEAYTKSLDYTPEPTAKL